MNDQPKNLTTDEVKKDDFAEYQSKKGVALELDGKKFPVHANLTAREQVEVWQDDSRILQELIDAVLEKAPGFCTWIAEEFEARELRKQAQEAAK